MSAPTPSEIERRGDRDVRIVWDDGHTSVYPNADHFLVFSHQDRFLRELSDWLKQEGERPSEP